MRRDRASGDFDRERSDRKRFDCHRHASERFDRKRFDCHRHASGDFDRKRFDCHRHASERFDCHRRVSERFDRERFDCHRHASKRFDCHRHASERLESVIVSMSLEVFLVGSGQDAGLLWLRRGDGAAGDGRGEAEATGDDQA